MSKLKLKKKPKIFKNAGIANADWMRILSKDREKLIRQHFQDQDKKRKKGSSRSGNWGHTGLAALHGGSDKGGGHSQVSGSKIPGGNGKPAQKPKAKPKAKPTAKLKKPEPKTVEKPKPTSVVDRLRVRIEEFVARVKGKYFQDEPKTEYSEVGDYDSLINEEWESNLSPEERDALEKYTVTSYHRFSKYLRAGADISDGEKEEIKKIDQALSRFEISQDMVVYRGADGVFFQDEDLEVGDLFTDGSFISTSTNRVHAERWASWKSDPLLFTINVPKGSIGAVLGNVSIFGDIKDYAREDEVLFSRQSIFRVDAYNAKAGTATITLIDQANLEDESMKLKEYLRAIFKTDKKKKPKDYDPVEKYTWSKGDIVIVKQKPKK